MSKAGALGTPLLLLCVAANASAEAPSSPAAMLQTALKAVVELKTEKPDGLFSGSGFIIADDGTIATNLHVIAGASRIEIRLKSGEVFDQVSVLAFDAARDIALVKIAGFHLPTIPLGDSDAVEPGNGVFALGHPLGLEDTITRGIVSSVRLEEGVKVIQTDAAISPGNSGGPLLDDTGNAIGVVSFKRRGENLNFAYPINYVRGLSGSHGPAKTLDQFNQELSGSRPASLFQEASTPSGVTGATSAPLGVTGRWRSLISNTTRLLRQDGERIYGEGLDQSGKSVSTLDCSKRADGSYACKSRFPFECSYFKPWEGLNGKWHQNQCLVEDDMEFSTIEANRIEGRVLTALDAPAPANTKAWANFCSTCGKSAPKTWQTFTWVREE